MVLSKVPFLRFPIPTARFVDYVKDETYYIDVNYYVYDTVDEFDATFTMDRYIQTFVFAKDDPHHLQLVS